MNVLYVQLNGESVIIFVKKKLSEITLELETSKMHPSFCSARCKMEILFSSRKYKLSSDAINCRSV